MGGWYPRIHGLFRHKTDSFNLATGFNNTVSSIRYDPYDNALWIGGKFSFYKGVTARRIIKVGLDGIVFPGFDPTHGFNGTSNSNVRDIIIVKTLGNPQYAIVVGYFDKFNNNLINDIISIYNNGLRNYNFVVESGMLSNDGGFTIIKETEYDYIIGGDKDVPYSVSGGLNVDGSTFYYVEFDDTVIKIKKFVHSGDEFPRFYHVGAFTYLHNSETHANRIVALNYRGNVIPEFNIEFTAFGGLSATAYDLDIDSNGYIYVVGEFTKYKNAGSYGHIIKLDKNGDVQTFNSSFTGFDKTPLVIKIDHKGKLLIGGSFNQYNSVQRDRIIRLNSNGSIDYSFDTLGTFYGFDGIVRAIEFDTLGNIYVGGDFTHYKSIACNRFVKLDYYGNPLMV